MDWRQFHDSTNHRADGKHERDDADRPVSMDPARRPNQFKQYEGDPKTVGLIDRREQWLAGSIPTGDLDLEGISRVLLMGAGAKRYRSKHLRGRYFRTYASAGGLHPNEVYLATGGVDGLDPGVYHFDPRGKRLVALGTGDPRKDLASATGDAALESSSTLIITGIPWRTSWKYIERGYRHLWWDAGMIIANVLGLADEVSMPTKVLARFIDADVERLVGVDGVGEMALALVSLGKGTPPSQEEFRSLGLISKPVGPSPYEFTDITNVHRSTALTEVDEQPAVAFESNAADLPGGSQADAVIWRRGSTRLFDMDATTPLQTVVDVMHYGSARFASDWGHGLCENYLIANAVDGLEQGIYRWDDQLELVRPDAGASETATALSLGQDLGGDGTFVVFPMADLEQASAKFGDRGYRIAQLEGAIISGRLYLAAYGCGLGATGLTFYDEEVTKYFGANGTPMLEVSIGVPGKREEPKPPSDSVHNLELENDGGQPKEWSVSARGYEVGVDGGLLEIVCSIKRGRPATVAQTVKGQLFAGKTAVFSAEIESDFPEDSAAGVFISVQGPGDQSAYDDMWDLPVKGVTSFVRKEVRVEVPVGAERLNFGMWSFNKGTVRFRNLQLEADS